MKRNRVDPEAECAPAAFACDWKLAEGRKTGARSGASALNCTLLCADAQAGPGTAFASSAAALAHR
jgi:hypothetical protein